MRSDDAERMLAAFRDAVARPRVEKRDNWEALQRRIRRGELPPVLPIEHRSTGWIRAASVSVALAAGILLVWWLVRASMVSSGAEATGPERFETEQTLDDAVEQRAVVRTPPRSVQKVHAESPSPSVQPTEVPPSEPDPQTKAVRPRRPPVSSAPLSPLAQDVLAAEVASLRRAKRTLAEGMAERALDELEAHRRAYPAGVLNEERWATTIEALCVLDRTEEASEASHRFANEHPTSSLARTLRESPCRIVRNR